MTLTIEKLKKAREFLDNIEEQEMLDQYTSLRIYTYIEHYYKRLELEKQNANNS